jgi:hypothetical protein
MVVDVPQLVEMSREELDALFRSSAAGEIPVGRTKGAVLVAPGTDIAWPAKRLIRFLAWRGKVFNPQKGDLLNLILPLGVKAVRAKVYKDASWLDQKETIVLDYSKTSRIAHKVRDEIREVSPGVYLGLVYWGRNRILHFTLTSTS